MSEELIYVNGSYQQVNSVKKQIDKTIEKITGIVPDDLKSLEELRIAINDLQHTVQDNSNNITAAMEKGRTLAKRDLFIAAGALYNDTDAAIERTAPWGESVQHLAGHYYLNGLGDITEKQMMAIYNRGYFNDSDKAPLGYGSHNPVRTNLCRKGMWNANLDGGYFAYSTAAETLNLHITTANTLKTTCILSLVNSGQFVGNAPNLRIIDPRALLSATTWSATAFEKCPKLEEVRIKNLKSNIIFKDSPVLSKASVLYMIQNAAPTTAITITLHADAYARLESDADIVAALETKNSELATSDSGSISLVSA